jgi:hypothetical protein
MLLLFHMHSLYSCLKRDTRKLKVQDVGRVCIKRNYKFNNSRRLVLFIHEEGRIGLRAFVIRLFTDKCN